MGGNTTNQVADNSTSLFKEGFKYGIPIMLGYLSVSFTFGAYTANEGMSPLAAIIMSFTNLTSSGQFAATNLILTGGSLAEIILVTIVINIRYMLMSISLTQKLDPSLKTWQKAIMAYGVTDEIFAIGYTKTKMLTFNFMIGLMLAPIFGWTLGTALGSYATELLPETLNNAMGIALYGMFIGIIIPPAEQNKKIAKVIIFSIILSSILYFVPLFSFISSGWAIIIVAILGAVFGAIKYPIPPNAEEVNDD